MALKLVVLVFFVIVVVSQAALDHHRYNGDGRDWQDDFKSLTPQQLAQLDDYLSHQLFHETATPGEEVYRNTRRPNGDFMAKRDALWTTTEVLDCVRRLRHFKDGSKLDVVAEMLNCYRRLKQNG